MSAVTNKTPEQIQTLISGTTSYSVQATLGEGVYGKVVKCLKEDTKEMVAVKLLKQYRHLDTEREAAMLQYLSYVDQDQNHLLKLHEKFDFRGNTCLAFEMLDISLMDLIRSREYQPLCLNNIRQIAQQLLVALDALKSLDVLHMDIKPDNIMVVNRHDPQIKVKLIDFGLAKTTDEVQHGVEVQPIGYRAPEVYLGHPITEAIDTWGVGCVLAYLFTGNNLFPVHCEYQNMKYVVETLGMPDQELLDTGAFTQSFFIQEQGAYGPSWRFMTRREFAWATSLHPKGTNRTITKLNCLDDLVYIDPASSEGELWDRSLFVDLLKRLLHVDWRQRITPSEALQHPFFQITYQCPYQASPDGDDGEMVDMETNPEESQDISSSHPASSLREEAEYIAFKWNKGNDADEVDNNHDIDHYEGSDDNTVILSRDTHVLWDRHLSCPLKADSSLSESLASCVSRREQLKEGGLPPGYSDIHSCSESSEEDASHCSHGNDKLGLSKKESMSLTPDEKQGVVSSSSEEEFGFWGNHAPVNSHCTETFLPSGGHSDVDSCSESSEEDSSPSCSSGSDKLDLSKKESMSLPSDETEEVVSSSSEEEFGFWGSHASFPNPCTEVLLPPSVHSNVDSCSESFEEDSSPSCSSGRDKLGLSKKESMSLPSVETEEVVSSSSEEEFGFWGSHASFPNPCTEVLLPPSVHSDVDSCSESFEEDSTPSCSSGRDKLNLSKKESMSLLSDEAEEVVSSSSEEEFGFWGNHAPVTDPCIEASSPSIPDANSPFSGKDLNGSHIVTTYGDFQPPSSPVGGITRFTEDGVVPAGEASQIPPPADALPTPTWREKVMKRTRKCCLWFASFLCCHPSKAEE